MMQLAKWRSHKVVWAGRILDSDKLPKLLVEAADGSSNWVVYHPRISAYRPVPGDYYVQYADGYVSVSPKVPFEEGYTREAE